MSASLPFQIFLKNRTLVPPETFGNIFAFDKESKRKLLSLISADSFIKNKLYIFEFRVEISFMPKWNFFTKKNFIQILWFLSCNICILVRLLV